MIIVAAEWESEQFGNIVFQPGRCPRQEHVAGLEGGTLHHEPRLLVIARLAEDRLHRTLPPQILGNDLVEDPSRAAAAGYQTSSRGGGAYTLTSI